MKKGLLFLLILLSVERALAQREVLRNQLILDSQYYDTVRLAFAAMKDKDYPKAIRYLTDVIYQYRDPYSYYNRGFCYDALGKYKEALGDYNTAIKINHLVPEPYVGIAMLDQKLDKPAEAATFWTKALAVSDTVIADTATKADRRIAVEKNKAEMFINLAALYRNNKDVENGNKNLDSAILQYSKLLETEPANEYYLSQRAVCYSELNQSANAIADYTRIINLKNTGSSSAEALYLRARQYAILKDYPKAIEDFTASLKREPQNGTALFYRAQCLAQLEKYVNACSDFKNAMKNGFKDSEDYEQIMADDPESIEQFNDCR